MIIAHPDSLEASLFLRVATIRHGNPDWVSSIRASHPFDWDRMTAFALLENAVTLLDDRVTSVPAELMPAEKRERIARLALIWTFKLKLLERRLRESLAVLSHAGIDTVLLKGAALALTTYRSFTDRPMADIDLLVDPARAREAYELMQAHGWVIDSTGHPNDAWDGHHHLTPLCDTTGSGLRLEIHVAPIPPGHPFSLDFIDVMSTSQLVEFAGIPARVPEPHLHAVHTAIHFAWSHRFESGGLNAIRDLAALQESEGFSWGRFVAAAHQTHAESSCYWAARLARTLAGVAVPDDVLSQLVPAISEAFLSLLEEHFSQLVLRSEHSCPSVTLRYRLWAFALQTNSTAKEESLRWDVEARVNPPVQPRLVTRIGSHFYRLRQWSLYVASMAAAIAG